MLVCVFLCAFAHETAGAARTRLSLRPLLPEGEKSRRPRAFHAARMRTHALAPFENERENVASNAWPAEEIAKHQNSPSSKGCLSKAGAGGFSSFSSTRAGQTMNPVTLVPPAVRLLASKLSHDQQRAIGRERYR